MKQRYTIAYRGLGAGAHRFEFQVGNDFWKGREESGIKGGDVSVEAVLEKAEGVRGGASGTGGTMRLEVAMEGSVVVPCDRCLEDCELPVDFRGTLAVRFSEEEHPFEGDILWLNPADGVIDLEQYIYESIVLSLPLQRVHPEDVHGQPLCNPAMLSRFKIVSEEEFEKLAKQ
jgi:uncharacterized metal-binding protein YceD (DUF177 family)